MIDLVKHLSNYGYKIEFTYDDSACSNALKIELGSTEYKKFWKSVDSFYLKKGDEDLEQFIRDYLNEKPRALKILLSGQIGISAALLEAISRNIKKSTSEKSNLNVIELGGGDGWAADYFINLYPQINHVDVLDYNYNNNKNPKIKIIKCRYSEFKSDVKYDMAYSILGIHFHKIEEMIECIKLNLKINGMIYLGLRISPIDYINFRVKMKNHGFEEYENCIETVSVKKDTGTETLPLFKFKYTGA